MITIFVIGIAFLFAWLDGEIYKEKINKYLRERDRIMDEFRKR